jgi:hypothetical protein
LNERLLFCRFKHETISELLVESLLEESKELFLGARNDRAPSAFLVGECYPARDHPIEGLPTLMKIGEDEPQPLRIGSIFIEREQARPERSVCIRPELPACEVHKLQKVASERTRSVCWAIVQEEPNNLLDQGRVAILVQQYATL